MAVKKSYRSKSPNDETLWSDDLIWLLSYKEVGFTNASCVESDGIIYSNVFGSGTRRIRYYASGVAGNWWLRSAFSAIIFKQVKSTGNDDNDNAGNTDGVVFGFCTD